MMTHGGDVAGYVAEYGRAPLDFSANVSPLGLPPAVRRAVVESLDRADQYPDPLCRELRAAIAAAEGCAPDDVLCGAGAAELIFRLALARRPRRALVTAPAFAEYEAALALAGCAVARSPLLPEEDFRLTARFLDDLARTGPDVVFLCQPNNPTGQLADPDVCRAALGWCRAHGALLVMDECFVDLVDGGEAVSLRPELPGGGLRILQAFNKTYAMTSLRLGYCLRANRGLLAAMAAAGQPWSVSVCAQAAGIAALGCREYVAALRALIARERPRLAAGLTARGCTVYGSRANFVFFAGPEGLAGALRRRGVLLRACGNYAGLDGRYFRAAVRTAPDNDALLAALGQSLEECVWQDRS